MRRDDVAAGFATGALVALLFAIAAGDRAFPPARADNTSAGEMLIVAGNGGQSQNRDTVFIVDVPTKRLAVYQLNANVFSMLAVRNIQFDMKLDDWSSGKEKQAPPVEDVAKHVVKPVVPPPKPK